MSAEREAPRRFIDAPPGAALDARLGELFRSLPEPRSLSRAELGSVRQRLEGRSARRARPGLRYALLLVTGMLAGTGFAVAAYGVNRLLSDESAPPAVGPAPRAPSPPPKRSPPRGVLAAPAVEPSAVEPSAPAPAPAPPASAASSPLDEALGREAELMSRALAALRTGRDPARALLLLDEHAEQFPGGAFRAEADLGRLDALLALGRKAEALAVLERLAVDRLGRGAELRVLRAELRAPSEPARALNDFDRALASGLSGSLEERALFGRAGVSLRLGDRATARADLERYLERYPNGRFATEARRQLAAR